MVDDGAGLFLGEQDLGLRFGVACVCAVERDGSGGVVRIGVGVALASAIILY